MSLERVIPNASLERTYYHQIATSELDKLDDAEALFERGRRLRLGIALAKDEEAGWNLIIESAKLGHPVALGLCFHEGRGTKQNQNRAIELYRASAERGHPAGSLRLLDSRECFASHQTLTNPKSSIELGMVLRERNRR
jgi:TPR repeat protein